MSHIGALVPINSVVVYRALCRRGTVLYIGVTDNIYERLGRHRRHSPWWDDTARVTWQAFRTRGQALRVESWLIRTLQPPHNVVGNETVP